MLSTKWWIDFFIDDVYFSSFIFTLSVYTNTTVKITVKCISVVLIIENLDLYNIRINSVTSVECTAEYLIIRIYSH